MNTPPADRSPHSGWYVITIQGRLASRWAARFAGMTLTPQDDGTTLIRGHVADQAALHGLLQQVRDTGLPLLSVTQAGAEAPPTPTDEQRSPSAPPRRKS